METESQYLRKAGQMAVKSELLVREWNPYTMMGETEIGGDDIYAQQEEDDSLTHLRVKVARADEEGEGFGARYHVLPDQLRTLKQPALHYVFAVWTGEAWGPYVVMSQQKLQDLVVNEGLGYETEEGLRFEMRYERGEGEIERIQCGDTELTAYVDDFSWWE